MSYDWEGNHRSGVALAMRHRLKWFIHLRAQRLIKGDEHPTNTLHGVWYSFYCQLSQIGCLPYFHTLCGLSANLGCRSEICCTRLAENTWG